MQIRYPGRISLKAEPCSVPLELNLKFQLTLAFQCELGRASPCVKGRCVSQSSSVLHRKVRQAASQGGLLKCAFFMKMEGNLRFKAVCIVSSFEVFL